MSKKFRVPLRIQFLIIALSLVVTSIILNMSAYLTDTDTYEQHFRTAAGDELGFKLTGTKYENDNLSIIPGNTVELNVRAVSEKDIELYIFVKLDIPADFELVGFYDVGWHPISEGSNIYYFGHSDPGALVALGSTNGTSTPVLNGIKLSTESKGGQNYKVVITGYAIQAANIDRASSPANVFSMIGGQ